METQYHVTFLATTVAELHHLDSQRMAEFSHSADLHRFPIMENS